MEESLESLLLVESSRRNTDMVADIVLKKPELFGELVSILLKNEHPVSWKAAWVADVVSEKRPDLLEPYLDELIASLESIDDDGVKREVLRMLCRSSFNEDQKGPLISMCFDWLISAREPVAVKRFSMEILYEMSKQEPGIKQELADSIEMRMFEESPGFQSYGKKLLKQLYKEMG
jgi:hypothetical protein